MIWFKTIDKWLDLIYFTILYNSKTKQFHLNYLELREFRFQTPAKYTEIQDNIMHYISIMHINYSHGPTFTETTQPERGNLYETTTNKPSFYIHLYYLFVLYTHLQVSYLFDYILSRWYTYTTLYYYHFYKDNSLQLSDLPTIKSFQYHLQNASSAAFCCYMSSWSTSRIQSILF